MTVSLRCEIFPADLQVTRDFYVGVLDFLETGYREAPPGPYLSLRRGQIRLGAALRAPVEEESARRPPTGVELVFEVDDVDAEYARVKATGWPIAEDLVLRPWGLWDFRITDPSGYYIRLTHS